MKRLIDVLAIAAALPLGVAATLSTHAQATGWHERRIDGSSEAHFEESVAALQNALPSRRREDFEIALAVI